MADGLPETRVFPPPEATPENSQKCPFCDCDEPISAEGLAFLNEGSSTEDAMGSVIRGFRLFRPHRPVPASRGYDVPD